ncbi:MAG TPA: hypothetical protein VMS11_00070 [Solirubrobacterales bacterium]|nr:hypothetical protein [Solirubrobacterales bacterium]
MLPLAHLGHWLWIFYVVPVLIVIAGILRSSLLARRRDSARDPGPEEVGDAGAPPAGGTGREAENGDSVTARRPPSR